MNTTSKTINNDIKLNINDPIEYEIYKLRLSHARITAHLRATDEVLARALALIASANNK